MSEYKFQNEVRERAENYVKKLREAGFETKLLDHTFRDYTVKLSIEKSNLYLGDAIVYYKPSQNRFTLGLHEMKNKEQNSILESVWAGADLHATETSLHTGIQAYVDGSFVNEKIGYGAVIIENGRVVHEFSGLVEDSSERFASMRQVGGEIQAVYVVIDWAQSNGIDEMEIHFDYEGLELWATGNWKTKNPYTAKYQNFMASCAVKIQWRKVKGHSGDRWNERADELARQACVNGVVSPIDLIADVAEFSQTFVMYLGSHGIQAYFDQIYNQMFSRIIFAEGMGKNFLDIYNTDKKRLVPKWHGFSDQALLERVKGLWNNFKHGELSSPYMPNSVEDDLNHEITHCLDLLRPYRGLKFDFIELANLVKQFQIEKDNISVDTDQMRYDFELIEKTYLHLVNGGEDGKY